MLSTGYADWQKAGRLPVTLK